MTHARSVGIRGAGVAGLTLARKLVEQSPGTAVTVFDTRPALPHPPRTFCFFGGESELPGYAVKTWRSVRFVGSDFDRVVGCAETPYTMVRGEDFFADTVQFLAAHGVVFRWSCGSIELSRDSVIVGSNVLRFDVVVDAAFDRAMVSAPLWQSFGGIVVETVHASFSVEQATLMDFVPSSSQSPIGFVYVLPFSPTEALVEHTTFSREPLSAEAHLAGCSAWLERKGVVVRREISREFGAIPMGIRRVARTPWPVIGTAGGGVRAGTGYGFVGIHQQAARLAGAIASERRLKRGWRFDPTPSSLRCGDALFLRALCRAPLQGRAIVEGLLKRAADKDIVAFLSGAAGIGQAVRVMAGVPRLTMVRALCS